jgi:nucleotide-binding universal stress UspA family protein
LCERICHPDQVTASYLTIERNTNLLKHNCGNLLSSLTIQIMRKHLIALDGKEQANYAYDWYLENIYRPGDEVVICHCSQFVLNIGLPGAAVNVDSVAKKVKEAVRQSEEIASLARHKLKAKDIKGHVVVKSGMKPEEAILKVVNEEGVTHIIMGTRGLGPVQRAFLGSVSSVVITNARVPVTIVKMPLETAH